MTAESLARNLALSKASNALKPGSDLPQNVFADHWSVYRFTSASWCMADGFADALAGLLGEEDGVAVCILSLSETGPTFDTQNAFYFDRETPRDGFSARLRREGDFPWLSRPKKYVCTSEMNSWCIYCDEIADIVVIALKENTDRFAAALRYMHAGSLSEIWTPGGSLAQDPFDKLLPDWRCALAENYP